MHRILAIGLVLSCFYQPQAIGADGALTVKQLLLNADKYNGKSVFVSAVAFIELENMALCSTRTKGRGNSCVWLEIDAGPYESPSDRHRYEQALAYWAKFHGKQVKVRGTFTSGESGHFGMWPGAIEQVSEVEAE
jgi:hypothetical protein